MMAVFFFGVVGPLGLLLGLGLLRRAADRSLFLSRWCVLFFKAFFFGTPNKGVVVVVVQSRRRFVDEMK